MGSSPFFLLRYCVRKSDELPVSVMPSERPLESAGLSFVQAPGEAAFYGPKIDVQVADELGRQSTLSTIQIDFHQPGQFGP